LVSYYGILYGTILAEENKERQLQPYQYLTKIQQQLAETHVKCDKVLRKGEPIAIIPSYCHEINAPLVIMATHARNAFERFMLGSVCWDLVQKADFPIMLVYSSNPEAEDTSDTEKMVLHL
jgi:nucleotide-binding universal stress UspA family protein